MKSFYFTRYPVLALLLACTPSLDAAGPAGKPQQLTSPDQVPTGLAKSDWSSIRDAYEAGRHAFQSVEGGWQARNPGQQWTTTFDGRGFIARPKDANWSWGLELQSYGFGDQQSKVTGIPAVKADGQRLSYQWDDTMQEWYVNDSRGLEHGYTVIRRPSTDEGRTSGEIPLSLTLVTLGTLRPTVSADAKTVHYRDDSNAPVVTYSGLKVWDADGRILTSRFEASGETDIRLLVEESGARYPLTIDPIAQQAYLKSGNNGGPTDDLFGYSVGVSGDTVIVGARHEASSTTGVNSTPNEGALNSGAAYVFVRSGTGWSQQAYLKASNSGAEDYFGNSVAISGDTVVVGALEDSSTTGVNSIPNENNVDSGAVYVFVRSGTVWSQQAYLKADNTGANDYFGFFSVAISSDTVVVGARFEDSSTMGVNSTPNENAADSGAAYVFVRSGTMWSQQAYLKAGNSGIYDAFGNAVAVSGDTVVVGAYQEGSSTTGVNSTPNESATLSGAAYVFVRSGTAWSQQAYLKASNTGASDRFGNSVAVSGDTVVVSAYGEDSSTSGVNSTPNENAYAVGAAYVFVRSGTVWSQQAYLKAGNSGDSDLFGYSVAISGDTVVVGAVLEDSSTTGVNSTPNEIAPTSGAGYVFVRSGTVWSQQAYLKAGNVSANDQFGNSVAISGNTVIIGSYLEDSDTTGVNSTPNENAVSAGAASVFVRSGTAWSQQAYLKASNTPAGSGAGDFFGYSVAVSGETVVVGACAEDSSTTGVNSTPNESAVDAGAAYVFVRSGASWIQQAYLKAGNSAANDRFGNSVAISGDTVVVGADYEDSSTRGVNSTPNENAADSGAVYVFVRNGTSWSQQAYLKAGNSGASDRFGQSIAISGDMLVVGAEYEDSFSTGVNNTPNESGFDSGAAYVFTRAGAIWSQQAYLKPNKTTPNDRFGHSVAASGDTLVVGANQESSSTTGVNSIPNEYGTHSGAAYVFVRSGTTWSQQAYLKASNTTSSEWFGQSVAVSGNTVVVGAVYEDSSTTGVNGAPIYGAIDSGAAYVFTRSGTTWSQQAFLKAGNTNAGDFFGSSVAVSGDTVVVGAYEEDSSTTGVNSIPNENASSAGAAYVFVRSGTDWSQLAYMKAGNTGGGDLFGHSVAVSGDTVVVGAYHEDSSTTVVNSTPTENAADSGAVYIYSGFGPVIAPPEIAIEQPLTSILADGGTRSFGSVALGESLSLTFTIRNTGAADLTGLVITQGGTNSADFTITASPMAPVTGPSGSTSFTVRFSPTIIGAKTAAIHIANNDADENPYDITLTGSGGTAASIFNDTIAANSSLSGADALPTAIPFNDGVENLLKYAFNMNLAGPDSSSLVAGTGTAGLPAFALVGSGAATEIRMEFLRRKGSGLIYTAKHSADLTSFAPMSGTTTVTSINDQWERVLVQQPCNPATIPKCFGIVEVALP